jgi:hypothetical protein
MHHKIIIENFWIILNFFISNDCQDLKMIASKSRSKLNSERNANKMIGVKNGPMTSLEAENSNVENNQNSLLPNKIHRIMYNMASNTTMHGLPHVYLQST